MNTIKPLGLRTVYSEQPLLLCGASADGNELYHVIDFKADQVRQITVDTTGFRARQRDAITRELAGSTPPYGLTALDSLASYFLDPHTFVETADGRVMVSMKQAPYVRLLDLHGGQSGSWPAPDAVDFSVMFGSSNCLVGPTTMALGATSGVDRLRRYLDAGQSIKTWAMTYDVASGSATDLGRLPNFVLDSFHELNRSPAGFYVGVDMNLSVDTDPDGKVAGFTDGVLDVDTYCANNAFPVAGFVVAETGADGRFGKTTVRKPNAACAAHVDFDLLDPTVFYISCHNISKWQQQVVIHGPGMLEKYRYSGGELELLGSFTEPEFLRITSQEPYIVDGRHFLACTGYPNLLYIIDTETMTPTRRIKLFDIEPVSAPLACPRNGAVPLYLAISEDHRYAFLTGATTLYVVDLVDGVCVDRVDFCAPGEFVASAHIALLKHAELKHSEIA